MRHRYPVAGRLAQADVARNHGLEDVVAEVLAHLFRDLVGKTVACVEHRQQNPLDFQGGIETLPDEADRIH